MAKPKRLSKPPKGSSAAAKEPEDENDFLEEADEAEKAGGKWRAGDTAKAIRFFTRAKDLYDKGLAKFPRSFDLSYNKARLLYELCENPITSAYLTSSKNGETRESHLRAALLAHRHALKINDESPDALFNTAQVLLSLSEELGLSDDADEAEQVKLVQEAVELLSACLSRQEIEFEENNTFMQASDQLTAEAGIQNGSAANAPPSTDEQTMETSSNSSEPSSQWANVEEPTTASTLLDTALASLAALGSLASLHSNDPNALNTIATITDPLISTKIPSYLPLIPTSIPDAPSSGPVASLSVSASSTSFDGTPKTANPQAEAELEAMVAIAVFTATFADAQFECGQLSQLEYFSRVKEHCDAVIGLAAGNPEHLLTLSDILTDFASTTETQPPPPAERSQSIELIWTALTLAKDALLQASKLPATPNDIKISIYMALGDVYLRRLRFISDEHASPEIRKFLPATTAQTAAVYYRGATSYAKQGGVTKGEAKTTAEIKGLLAEVLRRGFEGSVEAQKERETLKVFGAEIVGHVLEDMVDEGVLSETEARDLGERL